ncbi:MAG: NAD(P)/FAD-dependent oxidoreductase [Oscillospiraceae bacterium]
MDVIIIGNGPAGISASLYVARAGLTALVIGKDMGTLRKAEKIENYYGFVDGITGEELAKNGIEQAKRLGVEFAHKEVVDISFDEMYNVKTSDGDYLAKAVIIATGTQRMAPKINGLKDFEGRGVSYCATCDGFFYKKKDVAVIGSKEYALHEATELSGIANSVTLLTDGEPAPENIPTEIAVNTKKISELAGETKLECVVFEDGTTLTIRGAFIAFGSAGSTALATKLGAVVNGNKIAVDENMSTNLPGLYAAGDCTGGMYQVAKAVYEGARAGMEAAKFVRSK